MDSFAQEMLMRRLFDVVFAAFGLLLLSPLLLIIAVVIKTTSPGPVLYRQERLGLLGETFRIYKFRSMVSGADRLGGSLTVGGDKRVTPVGRFLRRHKLDELPQFLNVVRGEMALVGPRPEVSRYAALFPDAYRRILQVKPGITHRASIAFRNEEQLLASADDPDRLYVERVMPYKVMLYVDGLRQRGVMEDVRTIADTVFKVTAAVTAEDLDCLTLHGLESAAVAVPRARELARSAAVREVETVA
jgi:lipopolysaccharide/colanic/teichoic acid biosynthesis glycosyltransferase